MEGEGAKVQPLNDRVIIRPKTKDVTDGGLIVPDKYRELLNFGMVVSVGPGKRLPDGGRLEPQVRVGDDVMYGQYSGYSVDISGEHYRVMTEDEILATIKGGMTDVETGTADKR